MEQDQQTRPAGNEGHAAKYQMTTGKKTSARSQIKITLVYKESISLSDAAPIARRFLCHATRVRANWQTVGEFSPRTERESEPFCKLKSRGSAVHPELSVESLTAREAVGIFASKFGWNVREAK